MVKSYSDSFLTEYLGELGICLFLGFMCFVYFSIWREYYRQQKYKRLIHHVMLGSLMAVGFVYFLLVTVNAIRDLPAYLNGSYQEVTGRPQIERTGGKHTNENIIMVEGTKLYIYDTDFPSDAFDADLRYTFKYLEHTGYVIEYGVEKEE
ncbi:hypothetical protein SAMN02799630_02981 [Paenibacillus sp. UNCCL117]|uniref:hypothetical protein n=1 Tax=unclassified Paenibacillus TaxID=185978 RepID=UPI0008885819|nr:MULTISPECIES: hypothetical protein [unclassified Paenibacillus]SDE23498.1 hypothetical protein SAMN04488602_12275 [Paenibacillus sp. cl123]SFW42581.1 hypothetical protein SAMN02799630_02981 [Paenibacillus sp. UNCCL117]